jgi:hypothetical protein
MHVRGRERRKKSNDVSACMHIYARGRKRMDMCMMHTISKIKDRSFKVEYRNQNPVAPLCLF